MAEAAEKDRYAGLVVFGILQVVLGVLCAALALFIAARFELAQQRDPASAGGTLASGLIVYGLGAVYFLAVGIGSIRARRWARALALVVSAVWLAAGTVSVVMLTVILPKALRAMSVPVGTISGTAIALAIGFAIILPLALVLFYRSAAVAATVERRDPKPRWTDRTPLPVLAVVLVIAFGSIAMIANLASATLSLMGRIVTGAPAAMTLFALALLGAVLAMQLYRLREAAWWTLVLLQVIGLVYGGLTLARTDFGELSRRSGSPDLSAVYRDPMVIGAFIGTWLAYFAFLLYLRRYFVTGLQPRTRLSDQGTYGTSEVP
jgi:hypothetical protein